MKIKDELRFETEDGTPLEPITRSQSPILYDPNTHYGSLHEPVVLRTRTNSNNVFKIIEDDHVIIIETMKNMMLQERNYKSYLVLL